MSVAGRSEWATWAKAGNVSALTRMSSDELLGACSRLVVVAPHPDDEILSAGGWLAECAANGIDTLVILVSDGEASHPGSALVSPATLAANRPRETASALRVLKCADTPIVRLRLRDGHLTSAVGEIIVRLGDLVRQSDALVVPWRLDGHPDHEAVANAGLAAAASSGCRLFEAPIWMWQWRSPSDGSIPWSRAQRLGLSAISAGRKRAAMRMFTSQIERDPSLPNATPVVHGGMLANLCRDDEIFFA